MGAQQEPTAAIHSPKREPLLLFTWLPGHSRMTVTVCWEFDDCSAILELPDWLDPEAPGDPMAAAMNAIRRAASSLSSD